jgi:serine protease
MSTVQSGRAPVQQPSIAPEDPPRVGIKLTPAAQLEQMKDSQHIVSILEKASPGVSAGSVVSRLLYTRTPAEIDALVERAVHCDHSYKRVDLNTWYQVYLRTTAKSGIPPQAPPTYCDPTDVESLLVDLLKHPDVENAYALRTGPPPGPQFASTANGYLDTPANFGLDVMSAWNTIGDPTGATSGQGVRLVNIDGGWYRFPKTRSDGSKYDLYNDDLPLNIKTLNSMVQKQQCYHGNNVLGILLMTPGNNVDGSGIAPACQCYTMGHTFAGPPTQPAGVHVGLALLESLLATDDTNDAKFLLRPGDVILLETSTSDKTMMGVSAEMPSECEPPVFALIRIATAVGVIVVEPAGNAGVDLATVSVNGKYFFDKNKPADWRDSGAIMVGASKSTSFERWGSTNHGDHVDVFAWGENVSTTGRSGVNAYQFNPSPADFSPDPSQGLNNPAFGGTSAAAAIIAGAVMLIQGYARQHFNGLQYSPSQMRDLLKSNGTPSKISVQGTLQDTTTDIGVMPKLADVLAKIGQVPDIFLRHTPQDTGDGTQTLTTSNWLNSPDIMLNPSGIPPVSNSYRFGSDQTILVTLYNRGKADAPNATVDVYWAHNSDLVNYENWTLINTATVGTVPAHNGTTNGFASGSIVWPAIAGPTGSTTDLCLIAIASSPADIGANVVDALTTIADVPVDPATGSDNKQKLYLSIIQSNNNIAQMAVVFNTIT